MAKEFESDFYKELQNQVVKIEPEEKKSGSKLEELVERREQLIKALGEMKTNVVVDPKAVKKLEKELRVVEKAIEEGKLEAAEEKEQEIDDDEKVKESEEQEAVEEKEQEVENESKTKQAEEQEVEEENKEQEDNAKKEELGENEEENRDDILKEQYHEALVALYEHRINSIEIAKRQGSLLVSDEAFRKELILEKEMYRLRKEYMKLGYDDPFKEERAKFIEKEKKAKEPIEQEFIEKAREFKKYQEELARIDEEEQNIKEELLYREISSERLDILNARLEELGVKRRDLELKIVEVRSELEPAVEKRIERTIERNELESSYYNTLTSEEKASYRRQSDRVKKMEHNTQIAQEQEYRNIRLRIEEREHNIKMIKYELKRTETTDFERRIELLGSLDNEVAMLSADKETRSELDRGITQTETERKQDIIADYEIEQERKEEFKKDISEAYQIIEKQEEKIGEKVVEAPIERQLEEQTRKADFDAATFAMLADNPHKEEPDTLLDDAKQFVGAKTFIESLQEEVRDPNNLEDAEAMLANEERIEKANEELERKEEELEKRT